MLDMTIKELMNCFDTIFDAQEHEIFECEFSSYNEAFGAWVAYELAQENI